MQTEATRRVRLNAENMATAKKATEDGQECGEFVGRVGN